MSNPIKAVPKVRHKREASGGVYIGRPTKWGNPFVIGDDGTREEVIEKYREWIVREIALRSKSTERNRRLDLEELRGRDLVCWCAPLPCHGDVLLDIANRYYVDGLREGPTSASEVLPPRARKEDL